MKTRYFISTLIIALIPLILATQSSAPGYHRLKVGDTLPDYRVRNLINYPKDEVNLKDFRGKPLILDFWTSRCGSCIASWPKLLKLNEKFGDSVQLLLINAVESEETVRSVIANRKKVAGVDMSLPTTFNDSTFLKMFPHGGDPYIVWIDEHGVVRSISGGSFLNERSVSSFINTGDPVVPQRIDKRDKRNIRQPLYINGNGSPPKDVFAHVVFAKSQRTMGHSGHMSDEYSLKRGQYFVSCISQPIVEIYKLAYKDEHIGAEYALPNNRVVLEFGKLPRYTGYNEYGEILYDYLFTYQLYLKFPASIAKIQRMMQTDLDRYIGLNARMEKRKMKCYVLSRSEKGSIPQYKEGETRYIISNDTIDINNLSIRNAPNGGYGFLRILMFYRENLDRTYPMIDETGFTGKLGNIFFKVKKLNQEQLDKGLRKYGMRFTVEEREIEVLVLSEPEGYVFPFDTIEEENSEKKSNTN